MSNVIAITTHNRAELLKLNLIQLARDDMIYEHKVRVYVNEGFNEEVCDVIDWFIDYMPDIDIAIRIQNKQKCPLPGYHNILNTYALAANESDEYVIIGEEDIIPTDDYIRFNREVYYKFLKKYERIFCVAHKRRPETELHGHPEILIGDTQCTSPTCISVKSIKKYMVPIFERQNFWLDPVSYNNTYHRDSRIPPNVMVHHDGQIERIIELNELFALKPDQARTMHVGLSGIHCQGDEPQGTLNERLEQYKILIEEGGDALRARAGNPQDIVAIPLDGPLWSNLRLDTERTQACASSWWYDPENKFKEYIDVVASIWD